MKNFRLIARVLILISVSAVAQAVAVGQTAATDWDEANVLFQAKKWPEAVRVYERMATQDPTNGRAWYRLGVSLHSMGDYRRAIDAYQKAVAIANNPVVMYNLACSYARIADKDLAFEWLNKAISAGFAQIGQLKTDEDLEGLRRDARFHKILESAALLITPCEVQPEYRQFDFWVGEWDVFNPQGQMVGTNSIQRIVSGCIIFENWSSQASTGKSFNFYNSSTGKWHQTWIGSGGGVLDLDGNYKDGAMRYEGVTVGKDGSHTVEKLTFFSLSSDKVRQLWEQSKDDGKTWNVAFDGTYVRRKP